MLDVGRAVKLEDGDLPVGRLRRRPASGSRASRTDGRRPPTEAAADDRGPARRRRRCPARRDTPARRRAGRSGTRGPPACGCRRDRWRCRGRRTTTGVGNAVRGALRVDRVHLLLQPRQVGLLTRHVVARVVADLEAVPVQLGDLFPGEVVLLVGPEREPLGDEERRAEAVLLQQRPDDRVVDWPWSRRRSAPRACPGFFPTRRRETAPTAGARWRLRPRRASEASRAAASESLQPPRSAHARRGRRRGWGPGAIGKGGAPRASKWRSSLAGFDGSRRRPLVPVLVRRPLLAAQAGRAVPLFRTGRTDSGRLERIPLVLTTPRPAHPAILFLRLPPAQRAADSAEVRLEKPRVGLLAEERQPERRDQKGT